MNEFNKKESMQEEVSSKNDGEHAEAKVEVTNLPLSEDEDFATEAIPRENLFLIRANTKYSQVVRVNSRHIT